MSEKKNTPPNKQSNGNPPANRQPAASPSPVPAPARKSPDGKPDPHTAAPEKPETPSNPPPQKPADKPQASAAPKADTVKPADGKAESKPGHADKAAPAAPAKPANSPPPVPRQPATSENNNGRGLSLLALAISAVALALGGYQFMQNAALKSKLQDQRSVTQKEISRLDAADSTIGEQIAALRNDVANLQMPAPGMDRDSVVKTLAENTAKLEKSIAEAKTAALGEMEKRLAAIPQGLKREDVQSQIKQALATFAQGSQPTLDFSDEIAKVQASESSAKQVLAQIEQQANTLDSRLKQALSEAEKHLNDVASSQSSLVNLLALAQLAGHAGQYQAAAQYLQQADKMLTGTAHADWQGALQDAAKQYLQLSAAPSPTASLDDIISRVDEWPLRESGQSNLLQNEEAPQSATFMDKMQQIGSDILANTVTVMPLDDEGLAWISHNPALQNIIRQNVRLDLAFARNALQMQDKAAFTQITGTLKNEIERYFDTSHADVAAALQTLDALNSAQINLPDLAPMIQTLRSAP